MSYDSSESRFADRLAEITGANLSKIAAVRGEPIPSHPVEPVDAVTKLASMSLSEIMEHPAFLRGFTARLEERLPELDDAIEAVDLG